MRILSSALQFIIISFFTVTTVMASSESHDEVNTRPRGKSVDLGQGVLFDFKVKRTSPRGNISPNELFKLKKLSRSKTNEDIFVNAIGEISPNFSENSTNFLANSKSKKGPEKSRLLESNSSEELVEDETKEKRSPGCLGKPRNSSRSSHKVLRKSNPLSKSQIMAIEELVQQIIFLKRDFDITKELASLIRKAVEVAYTSPLCPQSGFQVGCAILVNGKIYHGVNSEDPSVRNCCCGERSAIFGTRSKEGVTGETMEIKESAVVAINPRTRKIETGISSSCGLCRQSYAISGSPLIFFIYDGSLMKKTIRELLPDPLVLSPKPLIFGKKGPFKSIDDHMKRILALPREGFDEVTSKMQELFRATIEEAQLHSYAPYYPVREGAGLLWGLDQGHENDQILTRANYQNASYGASDSAVSCVFKEFKRESSILLKKQATKIIPYPRTLAFFAFDVSDALQMSMPLSGLDRQIIAEEPRGLDTVVLYVHDSKLKCKPLKVLLPWPFTFTSIQSH